MEKKKNSCLTTNRTTHYIPFKHPEIPQKSRDQQKRTLLRPARQKNLNQRYFSSEFVDGSILDADTMSRANVFCGNEQAPTVMRIPVRVKIEKFDNEEEKKPQQSSQQTAAKKLIKARKKARKIIGQTAAALRRKLNDHRVSEIKKERRPMTYPRIRKMKQAVPHNIVVNAEVGFKKKCPKGFKRVVLQRQGGKSAGKLDTYYYSPEKHVLRSRPDIVKYLESKGLDTTAVQDFEFIGSIPKFTVVLGNPSPSIRKMKPKIEPSSCPAKEETDTVPVLTRVLRIKLERCDHLVLTPQTPPAECSSNVPAEDKTENDTENAPLQLQQSEVQMKEIIDAAAVPTESLERVPGWLPPASPYKIIYEHPDINRNLWKLLTASIIIYYKRMDCYVYKFFECFKTEKEVLQMTEDKVEAAMVDKMLCPLFTHTFELIQNFTTDFTTVKWEHLLELTGMTQYSYNVYKMFWVGDLQSCEPTSFELMLYKNWFVSQDQV